MVRPPPAGLSALCGPGGGRSQRGVEGRSDGERASPLMAAPERGRLQAFLGRAEYERSEVERYRAQRKLRGERCSAVVTSVLGRNKGKGGVAPLPKLQALQHVGALTGATKRKALLATSQKARHDAADATEWEKQWHHLPVCTVEETTGLMKCPDASDMEKALALMAIEGRQRRGARGGRLDRRDRQGLDDARGPTRHAREEVRHLAEVQVHQGERALLQHSSKGAEVARGWKEYTEDWLERPKIR